MKKVGVAAVLVSVFVMAILLSAPTQLAGPASAVAPTPARTTAASVGPVVADATPATPTPMTTFPRTVLIETFTAVWCIHCPAESNALYHIDLNTSHSKVVIAELHVCAFPPGEGSCLENYVPADGTSTDRGNFYNVCGFPDVFFDGVASVCGATDSASQMGSWYLQNISSAAAYPGNVSISQSATVSSGNVTEQANVTSGITGTYNAVSYLMEYIGKQNVSNGYGPHDIGNVVRETLVNHPVSLVAGETTEINATGTLNAAWNEKNLSVITLIQQNSTKIVENANMVPVSTLTAAIEASPATVTSAASTTVTIHVTNSSSNAVVAGATVNLTSAGGGSFSPATGTTASNGTFTSTFTAPAVTSTESIPIYANATATGYAGYGATAIVVNPLEPPAVPTGLSITPGVQEVTINWTAPTTGAGGVLYYLYQSASPSGVYALLTETSATQYIESDLVAGQSYWYEVDAGDAGGFSLNTSAISASSVTAASQGLPDSIGWWLSIDTMNFTSATSAPLTLYLGDGSYNYTYGTDWYARVPTAEPTAPVVVSDAPVSFTVDFALTMATLQGTVSPSNATVTLNGTAVAVVDGAFSERVQPGIYSLNVTTPGYRANTTSVTLAPGNVTTINVALVPVPSGSGTSSSSAGGLTTDETIAIVGVAVGVVALLGVIALLPKKGTGSRK
jgi:hypothetical protein